MTGPDRGSSKVVPVGDRGCSNFLVYLPGIKVPKIYLKFHQGHWMGQWVKLFRRKSIKLFITGAVARPSTLLGNC